ncbi:MAG: hypothetical protein M3R15_03575 [Acidobacteriota bacterium]|jgi:hypothetical protein|nr:hypothetical protein [Acidobacteriota bacterium]
MLNFRLTITTDQRQALDRKLAAAQHLGDLRLAKFILTIFAVVHYQETQQAALVLQLSVAQVEGYVHKFLCYGVTGVAFTKPTGRRPKLRKQQQQELCRLIEAGPQDCGFSGARLSFADDSALNQRSVRGQLQRLLHRRVVEEPRLQLSESRLCLGSSR